MEFESVPSPWHPEPNTTPWQSTPPEWLSSEWNRAKCDLMAKREQILSQDPTYRLLLMAENSLWLRDATAAGVKVAPTILDKLRKSEAAQLAELESVLSDGLVAGQVPTALLLKAVDNARARVRSNG